MHDRPLALEHACDPSRRVVLRLVRSAARETDGGRAAVSRARENDLAAVGCRDGRLGLPLADLCPSDSGPVREHTIHGTQGVVVVDNVTRPGAALDRDVDARRPGARTVSHTLAAGAPLAPHLSLAGVLEALHDPAVAQDGGQQPVV